MSGHSLGPWWPGIRDHIPHFTDKEAIQLRELAIKAHMYILLEQSRKKEVA